MTPQELRIGNWVLDKYGKATKIESINETGINLDIDFGEYGCINYDGRFDDSSIFGDDYLLRTIPLSEEILLACGFERELLMDDTTREHWSKDGLVYHMDEFVMTKGLHWLQNYHYFRTGTELEINL